MTLRDALESHWILELVLYEMYSEEADRGRSRAVDQQGDDIIARMRAANG